MRILHCIYDHPGNPWVGGGGAIRAIELNKRLASQGHAITMVFGNFPGADRISSRISSQGVSTGADHGIEVRFVGRPGGYVLSTFSYARQAHLMAREHGHEFDIIVEDFAPWNPVFTYRLGSPPAVLHINHREGLNLLRRRPLAGWPFFLIEKYYPSRFRHVTALSDWTRRKIGHKNAQILPAGIDSGLVEEGASAPPPSDRDDYVLFLGRLEMNNKGLDTLLEAVRRLGSTRVLLAGRGRDEQRLREMASGLPVEFLGFVSEERKRDLLKNARAFVLPSRFEGWGIAVLEAAACGTPVVVSDIPELNYALEDGYGVSFRTGDAGALAQALEALLRDEEAREDMRRKALEAATRHTWDCVAGIYEDYLKNVIRMEKA